MTSSKKTKLQHGFIGIGRMATIILQALIEAKLVHPSQVMVSRRSERHLGKIKQTLKVHTTTDNIEVVKNCPVLWIGVKPYQAKETLQQIAPYLKAHTLIISIMAGISTHTIRRYTNPKARIIRLMPNTPVQVGEGLIGVYFSKKLPLKIKQKNLRNLSFLGKTVVCKKESELNAITGLSGSGVAMVYLLAQGMITGGKKAGLSFQEAKKSVIQTLLGGAKMLSTTQKEPSFLIEQVCSKGGTTEVGIKILKVKKVAESLEQAVLKASERALAIQKEYL